MSGLGARCAVRRFVAAFLTLCLISGGSPAAAIAAEAAAAPDMADVRAARDLAAGYMKRNVRADGSFVYLADLDPDVEPASDYNILRHAGSVWAMYDYHRSRPTAGMSAGIQRASGYLRDRRVAAVPGVTGLRAVWSYTEDDGDAPSAKLGGTGLGLVALTSAERIRPGSTSLTTLRALGRFLVYMQKSDGSFYTQYVPSRGGRVSTPISLYYPGEAALGLLMLYELDPQPIWIQSATKALAYLAQSRAGQTDLPADHWALIATQKLMQLAPRAAGQVQVPRQLLMDHVVMISESIVDSQVDSGAFSESGGSATAATRLEGLLAALGTLPAGHASRPRIRSAVDKGIAFLVGAQVTEGEHAGAFTAKTGSTEIRIDYVQHSLSAMTRYAGDMRCASTDRLSGADRYATAVAVSKAGWPSGAAGVVIATGGNHPDALAAAPLAKAYGGPVLLTKYDSLGSELTAELGRLAPRYVFIAGGTGVVSPAVASQLAALPSRPRVVRLGGADRYETAALIARRMKAAVGATPKVVVCTGSNFTDGLSVAPLAAAKGWPMLLAKGGTLTPATRSALAYLAPTSSLLVGTRTTLPETIRSYVPASVRVYGSDGPGTSVAVAKWAKASGYATLDRLGVAASGDFPDALAAGPYLGRDGGMLLLTPASVLPPGTAAFLETNELLVEQVDVVGGTGAVPRSMVDQVIGALR